MSKNIQAVRGMNDILPNQTPFWQLLESQLRKLSASYGYGEIRLPIVESTHLFKRTIGEVTDIVEKEMYTFEDRNGDSLSLRPEGTAGCVRAGIEHGLLYNQIQRFWYMGPMFRHERPQKGRYRQFFQFGLEAFGMDGPDIDAEQILFTARLWQQLGIADQITLQINTLGHAHCREKYRDALVEYFSQHKDQLDEDSLRRLEKNPLRILDSKNPALKGLIDNAPVITDHIDEDAKAHFDGLKKILNHCGVSYEENPRLVRGLDYYGLTIYEWVSNSLGAQGTVCAGGRYNKLVDQLGGKATPAVGFAIGLERVVILLESVFTPDYSPDVYWIAVGDEAVTRAICLAEKLRIASPELRILMNCGGGSFKSQFKRADKSGARIALILGEDEMKMESCSIKFLQDKREQINFPIAQLNEVLLKVLSE